MAYVENKWKPISVAGMTRKSSAGTVGSNQNTFNWYNQLIQMGNDRSEKLEKYRMMDRSTDIFRALDIIAEDVSSTNADDDDIFELYYGMEEPKNTLVKTVTQIMNKWQKVTEFDYRFFEFIREMIKYGICMFEEDRKGNLKKLKQDRIIGYVLNEDDEDMVTHYIYDPNKQTYDECGNIVPKQYNKPEAAELRQIPVEDLLIFKNGEGPFGESILDKIFNAWRRLQLLEDAVVIYRIVRAPERRVFYIDIGKMPAHKSESYIERIKNKMRQRQISKENGIETDYNPASMQEDFFLGTTSDGKGSRVETLPGGDNLGRIEDLQFFNKKLALGLRIPPSYMDSYSDDPNGQQYNDGRLGTAYIAEIRYAGFVKRMQTRIAKELTIHFKNYSNKNDVELPEDFELNIAEPQSFSVYKEIEKQSAMLNIYSSAENLQTFSKREALKKFMNMDEEEITNNEKAKLMEMGFTPKDIKEFPPEVRYNFVYSDGEAGRRWIEDKLVEQGDLSPELSSVGQEAMNGQENINNNNNELDDENEEPTIEEENI